MYHGRAARKLLGEIGMRIGSQRSRRDLSEIAQHLRVRALAVPVKLGEPTSD